MKTTQYLTNKDPDEFLHLIMPLAEERVMAMREALKVIREVAKDIDKLSDIYYDNVKRYREIETSIKFWQQLAEGK